MARRLLLLFVFLILNYFVVAQAIIPFEFTSEDDNKLLKENDSLKYYTATDDTDGNTVCINEEASYYQLLNKNHKIIAEGGFILEAEKYLQDGKWVERFDNGKVKITGYYSRNKPAGTWQEFHPNGKVSSVSNYAILTENGETSTCLSGTYQEFYENGKLKVNGFYSASRVAVHDTIYVQDPVTGITVHKNITRSAYTPAKAGHWEYYTDTGELDKQEDLQER